MTTKRMSFQMQQQASHHHHHHHHAQRRPPDVEEALSSMLWTPYERASTTDTSSDDEDEHLQRQLKKSKSQYDYTSVPTTIPPLTPPPPASSLPATATLPMPLPTSTALALPTTQFSQLPPTHLTPTNIVAYITTATPLRAAAQAAVAATSLLTCTPVRTASAATATSSYYTAEDLCDPSVVTPLVPFSNFMLNAHTMTTTTSTTAANNNIDVDLGDDDDDDDDDVDVNGDVEVDTIVHDINIDDTFNDVVVYRNENRLAATSSSLTMMSSSYQQKNRYSSTSSSSSTFSTFGRIPSLTKWWSTSGNTQSNTVSIAARYDTSNAVATQHPPTSASTLTDEANKQPPSYESLYNKKQHPLRPQRSQRHTHSHNRLNKHLNLFKPVLETLKANVTTITQGRFTSLVRPDNNCRVTNNTMTTATTNALNHATSTLTPILTTAIETEAMGENSNNSTESTSNNLVHSFTDNFLHEHCPTTQHVAATNVANNVHIINNNHNNNNNDTLTTDNNMNGETPNQSHEILIHQQQQQQQHMHLQESTNIKSKQNQEHENKQNNNFIISQQQHKQQKQEQLLLTITTNENNRNVTSNEQTKMNIKTKTVNEQPKQQLTTDHRETTMDVLNTTTTTSTSTTSMVEESGLLYDSSSAISLTRSFEANTSYTFDCTPGNANSFNKFSYETRKINDTSATISNTYNLTPNKCLAELERLYAEFRASESIREQKLREHQNLRLQNVQHRNLKDIATETENMRLNVPASNSANAEFNSRNSVGVVKAVSETKLNPSTSSVFLTTTNSLTTITNPCQRTPSLTIQVNQNQHSNSDSNHASTNTNKSNNNNHNNNNNNNNINNNNNNNNDDDNNVASATNTGQRNNDVQQQVFLNQAIVNTTTNGVSVINCNYVNNNNYSNNNSNNHNNNNNKSITNLQDSVTNSNSKSISNPTSSANNLNNNHDPTDHAKSNNNHMPGGVSDNIPNSSVPQVLNASDENPPTINSSPLKQVNVIKVNERVEKSTNSNASTPAQTPRRRTFTSTECQTDDIASVQLRSPSTGRPPLTSTSSANSTGPLHSTTNNREQRRRERRERRHLQHTASLMVAPTHHSHPHPPHPLRHASLMDRHSMPTPPLPPILHPPHLHLQQTGHHNVAMLRPMLPDILHNHFPPPYSALPPPPPPPTVGSGSVPHHHNGSPLTFSHAPPPPPTQTATATILGPPPPPPPAGTTLLTSVISTVPIPGATPMVSDGRFTLPLPIMRRSPSERSGKGCCGQWFAGPPLRALIAVVALGGVACALGGAALGATGLAGPPSSHFTAALLMIGVGVVLVTVSGAAWRMTAPGGPPCLGLGSSVDLGRCGRRPCSRGGGAPQGLLYPEFQHRPPPPSYQASMQEYRLRLLLLDRDRQNGVVRGSSPPPTYRSHAGSLLRAPLTSTIRGTHGLSGGRCESSIGGSEYSFPPSYRSRNTTPGTISSERSIETEPSGRLLANEDIPEPLSVDQLSEYNSLQQRTLNTSNANSQKSEQKRNSIQLDSPDLVTKSEVNLNNLNSDKKNDLVTIVTITPNSNDIMEAHENRNNVISNGEGSGNEDLIRNSESREQIEILAHL